MMRPEYTPYQVGQATAQAKTWGEYLPYEDALWQAFSDFYYADHFGFGHCRQPAPGAVVDYAGFEQWKGRLAEEWAREARNRDNGILQGRDLAELPPGLLESLYERAVDAKTRLKPPPTLQQPSPDNWNED